MGGPSALHRRVSAASARVNGAPRPELWGRRGGRRAASLHAPDPGTVGTGDTASTAVPDDTVVTTGQGGDPTIDPTIDVERPGIG
jgi:hypothetical protein